MLHDVRGSEMKPGLILMLTLAASVLLRVRLITAGGQFYWPDETRYEDSRDLVTAWARGDYGDAFGKLDKAEHPLFRVIGIIPAEIERAAGRNVQIPAFVFGMASVVSIGLLWAIARRAHASDPEALFAAGLLALSSTFFYYSRHLFPYDLGMAFGLMAIFVGLHSDAGRVRSVWCGLLACAALLTYEGYWALAAVAVLIHVVSARPDAASVARRAFFAACGLVAPPLVAVGVSALLGGHLFASFLQFSQSANQGSLAEGWRLPFEYLWHAEHLLLVLWAVAAGTCAWQLARGDGSQLAWIGVVGACAIYAALAVSSTGLHMFVVYGRAARQLVPFLCLIAAHELERLRVSDRRWKTALVGGIGALAVVQAAANFREPLQQVFPSEFRARTEALVHGDRTRYAFVNAEHIYPRPKAEPQGPYRTLAQAKHPLAFLPYQYEGFDREQRETLRSSDLTMRLVEFGATD